LYIIGFPNLFQVILVLVQLVAAINVGFDTKTWVVYVMFSGFKTDLISRFGVICLL